MVTSFNSSAFIDCLSSVVSKKIFCIYNYIIYNTIGIICAYMWYICILYSWCVYIYIFIYIYIHYTVYVYTQHGRNRKLWCSEQNPCPAWARVKVPTSSGISIYVSEKDPRIVMCKTCSAEISREGEKYTQSQSARGSPALCRDWSAFLKTITLIKNNSSLRARCGGRRPRCLMCSVRSCNRVPQIIIIGRLFCSDLLCDSFDFISLPDV